MPARKRRRGSRSWRPRGWPRTFSTCGAGSRLLLHYQDESVGGAARISLGGVARGGQAGAAVPYNVGRAVRPDIQFQWHICGEAAEISRVDQRAQAWNAWFEFRQKDADAAAPVRLRRILRDWKISGKRIADDVDIASAVGLHVITDVARGAAEISGI